MALVIGKWMKRSLEDTTFRVDERIRYDRYSYGGESLTKARNKIRREAKNCGHDLSRFATANFQVTPVILAHCKTPGCRYAGSINTETFRYTGPDMFKCPLST